MYIFLECYAKKERIKKLLIRSYLFMFDMGICTKRFSHHSFLIDFINIVLCYLVWVYRRELSAS